MNVPLHKNTSDNAAEATIFISVCPAPSGYCDSVELEASRENDK